MDISTVTELEVTVLNLKENDLLVFKYTGENLPDSNSLECLIESLHTALPKGVKALVLGGEFEIYVVHKEEE